MFHRLLCTSLLAIASTSVLVAAPAGVNYDESKVPELSLPDPLTFNDGTPVTSAQDWQTKRRGEVLELLATHVYGRTPAGECEIRFGEPEVSNDALDGTAIRKQVKIYFGDAHDGPTADLLIYLPADAKGPTPVFVGMNFGGNHTVAADPGIWLPQPWTAKDRDGSIVTRQAEEKDRGRGSSRWPVNEIIARGYGMATIFCNDVDPDYDDGFQNGVHPLFHKNGAKPGPDEWGTLGAWAWGLSRAVDYFETDADIDHEKVALVGHSRLGKAAMWAGASDERFALVISNNSGCGGAALSRRQFGETVQQINKNFPHWFCGNFKNYNDNEADLPVDQHMLLALVAPRPLYVASAEGDQWADPRGEFLSLRYASPVFELLGRKGIGDAEMPAVEQPIQRDVAYHIRSGRHDITLYDWQRYMDFADQQFERDE